MPFPNLCSQYIRSSHPSPCPACIPPSLVSASIEYIWHQSLRLCSDSRPCSGVFLSRSFIIVDCMIAGQVVDYNKYSTFDIQLLKGSVISVDFDRSMYRKSRFVLLLEDICSCDYLGPVRFRMHSSWSHITNNQGSDLHSSHYFSPKFNIHCAFKCGIVYAPLSRWDNSD